MKLATPARWLWIFVLGGFLTVAGIAARRAGRAQSAGTSGDPAAENGQTQTTTPPAKKRGVWHHFGDQKTSSGTRPAPSGGWHYFGRPDKAPATRPFTARAAPARPAPRARRPIPRQPYRVATTRDMERQMFALINRDRRDSGGGRLRPLRWDAKLAAVARAHSRDMVRGGYFGHVAPDGQTVIDRLSAAKIPWKAEGENIAIEPGVTEAERAFMNEPRFQKNHRWNILNGRYTAVGVGIVRGPDGEYYITQDFIERETAR